MERISKYLTLAECIKSQTAIRRDIDNMPTPEILEKMKITARRLFDPSREFIGGPLFASSFYRSPELNSAIGGSTTSQHCKGEAIDMDADVYRVGTNAKIFHFIKDNLEFDQLIWEFGDNENPAWVHASATTGHNRRQILVAFRDPETGRTRYKAWK